MIKDLRVFFSCILIISIAHWVYPSVWSFWSKEVFGWGPGLIGISLACYGLGVAFVQGIIIRMNFIKKSNPLNIVIFSLILGSLTLFGFGSIKTAWLVFALIPIAVLTELMNPTLDSFISNKVSDDTQGLLQGILSSINAITIIISPLIMTFLFKLGSSTQQKYYLPGLPFYFSALLLLSCILPILKAMNSLETTKKREIK